MDETARQNALRALQRSMDRRDNGGETGHECQPRRPVLQPARQTSRQAA
jgi:hypothetical protein